MTERPLEKRGVHAVVSREHAQGSELINALNRGLKQLKQSDTYSSIVQRHVMRLWDPQVSASLANVPATTAPITGLGVACAAAIFRAEPGGARHPMSQHL
jgi:hypothetical protein